MTYHIESHGRGREDWDRAYVEETPDANTFDSEEEAHEAIESLRQIGSEWAAAEYRVVEDE
jgi:hypothetical protein